MQQLQIADVVGAGSTDFEMLTLQGSAERSQQLNEAYAMLTEMTSAELVSYERELRLRGPAGPTLKCAPLCSLQAAAREKGWPSGEERIVNMFGEMY